MNEPKQTITFPERAIRQAIEMESQILESNNKELLDKLETEGIETKVGNFTIKYQISGDDARIDFIYKDYLLLGYYKGKAKSSKNGLVYQGKFYKKAPSNLYRLELKRVRDALQNQKFKFTDTYKRVLPNT